MKLFRNLNYDVDPSETSLNLRKKTFIKEQPIIEAFKVLGTVDTEADEIRQIDLTSILDIVLIKRWVQWDPAFSFVFDRKVRKRKIWESLQIG